MLKYDRKYDVLFGNSELNCDMLQEVEHINSQEEISFCGIVHCYAEVASWKWVYGKTPKFSVSYINRWRIQDLSFVCGGGGGGGEGGGRGIKLRHTGE